MYGRTKLRLILHKDHMELDGFVGTDPAVLMHQLIDGARYSPYTRLIVVKDGELGLELATLRLDELANLDPDHLPI